MELLVGFGTLVLLAVLALRFGADSRPGFRSEEHTLAAQGYVSDLAEHPAPASTEAPLASPIHEVTASAVSAASETAPATDGVLAA